MENSGKSTGIVILITTLLCSFSVARGVSPDYREHIELHIGRAHYVAGESVWYTAYGIANQKEFLSTTIYVELINSENEHITGQIVKIENGVAASVLTIPDTLGSGSYTITAYTNWMRNFDEVFFFSFPVVVYNQYDELNETLRIQSLESQRLPYLSSGNSMSKYIPGERVTIPLAELIGPDTNLFSLSVSVYKRSPDALLPADSISFLSGSADEVIGSHRDGNSLADSALNLKKNIFPREAPEVFVYAIEDIGILYTGTLENSELNQPIGGIDIHVALEDTIACIMASKTDRKGKFVFLIDRIGVTAAYFDLYTGDTRLGGNYRVELDEKFHYSLTGKGQKINLAPIDTELQEFLKDEADRVIIQRAFDNFSEEIEDGQPEAIIGLPFYGEPGIVVYPDIYFDLPNFEEIAREILPRVRYNKNKKGCEAAVIHIESSTRSETPIFILDGVLVKSYCDVYPLRSPDIDHIEVQSGFRVSGNLAYNGLVAIFTSKSYKLEHSKSKGIQSGSHIIVGYSRGVTAMNSEISVWPQRDGRAPDFRNLLYWNTDISEYEVIEFNTSDEVGEYIIDCMGITKEGKMVSWRTGLKVALQ
jgi:hypothetical protein